MESPIITVKNNNTVIKQCHFSVTELTHEPHLSCMTITPLQGCDTAKMLQM